MRNDMLSDQSGWAAALGETPHTFCATMQLRTPLRVLLRHGEVCPSGIEPPAIAEEMWQGIWIPTLEGMGLWGTMSSQVGYIPASGGLFLQFLIAVREAIENSLEPDLKAARLERILADPKWHEFIEKLGGSTAVSRQLLKF